MDHIRILKAAYHMNDGIYLTDVSQKLVAQALTLGSALYQTCNIYKLNNRRGYLFGMVQIPKQLQTVIRNCNHTHIRVNGTERIVGRLCASLGQRVEQGTLADVRQTHDT